MMNLITELDHSHRRTFPRNRKKQIMERIMGTVPQELIDVDGPRACYRTVRGLRSSGMGLIDFQPMETGFITVWYSERKSLFGLRRCGIAAQVVWQAKRDEYEFTTVSIWHI